MLSINLRLESFNNQEKGSFERLPKPKFYYVIFILSQGVSRSDAGMLSVMCLNYFTA